jgi:hypothetical protein
VILVPFPRGAYKIIADLAFLYKLRVRMPKGAILAPHEIACAGTISTKEPGDANSKARITIIHRTEKVVGSGTKTASPKRSFYFSRTQ